MLSFFINKNLLITKYVPGFKKIVGRIGQEINYIFYLGRYLSANFIDIYVLTCIWQIINATNDRIICNPGPLDFLSDFNHSSLWWKILAANEKGGHLQVIERSQFSSL